MPRERKIRIGVDVGGTFTHAVALDASPLELIGKSKVPTTHRADEGVARGVVESLLILLDRHALTPDEVVLIAHSTTQATNALLEGDVAHVGIIGMGGGTGAWLARRQTAIKPIPLAPGRLLHTSHHFIHSRRVNEQTVNDALDALQHAGAAVVVAAEAFSVDDPAREELVCELATQRGLPATATSRVSRLHGLGIRTRTAVINASMLPKMLSTADMTEKAVRAAGIRAPVMIMRSDGGVMDIAEMRRRPILTMLSGPAAGVAAALLYARVSDGLFIEVGGTSTDISVIKNGRCQIRSAEVGGQKLHVSTLDVRTVGLAGGSLVYLKDGAIKQVGPRSTHIAGLRYLSFNDLPPDALAPATHQDGSETYLAVSAGEEKLAVTPTCASNLLGLVPPGDCAAGRRAALEHGFQVLARQLNVPSGEALAETIMRTAAPRVSAILEGLMQDYKLDPGVIRLIGGGGGASAVVPYVARSMGLPHELVDNADVISAIGVALALVRDSVERTVVEPSEEDIRRIRDEAFAAVLKMGAAAETIEVFVEVDAKRNLLRATAEGSTEIRAQELRARELTEPQRRELVAASIGPSADPPRRIIEAAGFEVWSAECVVHRLWKFLPQRRRAIRVLDRSGAIRWASSHADVRDSTVSRAERDLEDFAETYTRYSDAGATIPRCHVLLADRIVDLSGLVEMKQVLEVLRIELKRHPPDAACVLLLDL
jgi:N-methylhydantoinase A/oxoprolinase/acetone carboxylase beta subunit